MKNLQQMLDDYISRLGPPTLRSEAELRNCVRRCRLSDDHNIFYLIVDARKGPKAVWGHNIRRHFGLQSLDQLDIHDRIHPQWRNWYESMSELIYRIGINQFNDYLALGFSYSVSVPLKQADGCYHWYRQLTRPVTFDADGNIVHFIMEMRLLCAYDLLAPEMPKLVIAKMEGGNQLQPEFQRIGYEAMMNMLLGAAPPASISILQAYCRMALHDGTVWRTPDKISVEKKLGLKREALNKGIVRLMKSVRANLPSLATGSVTDLVNFLNDLFGQPKAKKRKIESMS